MNFKSIFQLFSLFLLISIAVKKTAIAQLFDNNVNSKSIGERVAQLEHVFNAHNQLLIQLQQQMSENQDNIDLLRGQIQDNQHQLNQVIERQKQISILIDTLIQNNDNP